ncbi:ribosome biogenesis GTPase [Niveomyces insectorum RCEF 264]|uniref:Ribosome biogenesis GTPase n=1 Tax=Niveomyces insectorum RCEF 264 TaxID=1081102 RepID=A0A162I982_9HYPO|nr:ribosome biogenesis GTPase [Niveomyces insectorum RCEF 264]
MNDRFGKGKGSERRKGGAITRTNHATGEQYITNEHREAGWVKMRSVTEQGALDEFLATAQLAGTDFTAQKMNNVKIIHTDQKNPYLLTAGEERATLKKHKENWGRLTVPRRPHWNASTTPAELDTLERESFLAWRRELAELQENQDLLMTPFERNLEVWRQMWRVIERSDLVVQIVDARNPLLFRSADLEDYVKEVDPRKENLLLINKADMMTPRQRRAWAAHLKTARIAYKFFSAHLAKEQNGLRELDESGKEDANIAPSSFHKLKLREDPIQSTEYEGDEASKCQAIAEKKQFDAQEVEAETRDTDSSEDVDTRILTVEELESLFLQLAPKAENHTDQKLQIGLVGYPNVVSSTPGKTKHFQTIHLSDQVVLCDCPGLVFPNFATTKAELVCNGILPIDQLREFSGPAGLVARRIPQPFLEAVYGLRIRTRPIEEGGIGMPTAEELLTAYARARGFTKTGLGQPDEARAARYILKDYVNGKLLYCAPPPDSDIDPTEFNHELYDTAHLPAKRQMALLANAMSSSANGSFSTLSLAKVENGTSGENEQEDDEQIETEEEGNAEDIVVSVGESNTVSLSSPAGPKSQKIDSAFFAPVKAGGRLHMPFSHQYTEQGRAAGKKQLSGRKARLMVALENGREAGELQSMALGKKHFKGGAKPKGKKKVPSNAVDD